MITVHTQAGKRGTIHIENNRLKGSTPALQRVADQVQSRIGSAQDSYHYLLRSSNGYVQYAEAGHQSPDSAKVQLPDSQGRPSELWIAKETVAMLEDVEKRKSPRGNAQTLRDYWTGHGHGGPTHHAFERAIAWGTPGDFDRCVAMVTEHAKMSPEHAKGYCVTEDARVLSAGSSLRLLGSFERYYIGDVIAITTSTGNQLTVTPNHPIATRSGWVPAAELQPGDHVLCSLSAERMIRQDEDDIVPRIKQVAQSLSLAFTTVTRAVDFHGDSTDGEVHVVRANSLLVDDALNAMLAEHAGELLLVGSDHGIRLARAGSLEPVLSSSSAGSPVNAGQARVSWYPMVSGDVVASQNVVDAADRAAQSRSDYFGFISGNEAADDSRFIQVGLEPVIRVPNGNAVCSQHVADGVPASAKPLSNVANLKSGFVESNYLGVRVSPVTNEASSTARTTLDFNASLAEKLLYGSMADSETRRDFRQWLSVDVALRDVVSVERRSFSGHVYDLSTDTGVFTAETLVSGPCNLRHHDALGIWPATHAKDIREAEGKEKVSAASLAKVGPHGWAHDWKDVDPALLGLVRKRASRPSGPV